ncbi:hypothetical protein SAMN04489735_104332 [Aneurinibacillus thermoaerophilus]|uniref:Uncharacterized protein n=1 Tax=Aneurinibacillus thermoaerophilus TaxID=143495 RepID=A0A1G8EFS5_ANETH|nr:MULTISPECIES: hypothetical protein [Aneurinibacillus]AMA71762.1 hypothetical protein ACH33_02155 [Aneurinibacillus sp. XH2]SDH68748.1 hypothetical protein SAMN04489735_104332 [Aneurinibacillus thermoaerophilus]
MKKSLITNTHGFTSETLRKEERAISDAFFRQRVTVVRLILEGFSTVRCRSTGHLSPVCLYVCQDV